MIFKFILANAKGAGIVFVLHYHKYLTWNALKLENFSPERRDPTSVLYCLWIAKWYCSQLIAINRFEFAIPALISEWRHSFSILSILFDMLMCNSIFLSDLLHITYKLLFFHSCARWRALTMHNWLVRWGTVVRSTTTFFSQPHTSEHNSFDLFNYSVHHYYFSPWIIDPKVQNDIMRIVWLICGHGLQVISETKRTQSYS